MREINDNIFCKAYGLQGVSQVMIICADCRKEIKEKLILSCCSCSNSMCSECKSKHNQCDDCDNEDCY